MGLCDYYLADKKEYFLNEDIYSEMLNYRLAYLDMWWEVEPVYYELDEAIVNEFSEEEKINTIDKFYKKYLSIIKNKRIYNLYKNNFEKNGYESFFEYFLEQIGENDKWESLEKYLNGIKDYLPLNFKEELNNYYSFKKISDYCEEKKNEILNIKKSDMKEIKDDNQKKNRDMSFRLAYLEKLMKISNWDDLNPTQKGNILSPMFGDYPTNIRDYYAQMEKNNSHKFKDGSKWFEEQKEAEEIIKKILG